MIKIDGGTIIFDGKNILKKLKYLRKNTGFATQENMLFDELTLKENAFYSGKLYGVKRKFIKERFFELINLLGLAGFENTLIRRLSGGMIKRANFLVSLIHNPRLLILDEPTIGLDPILRKTVWGYIHRINQRGTTILVISHLLDEIGENCSRIGLLKGGKIITVGSLSQYKESYGDKSLGEIFKIIEENENI